MPHSRITQYSNSTQSGPSCISKVIAIFSKIWDAIVQVFKTLFCCDTTCPKPSTPLSSTPHTPPPPKHPAPISRAQKANEVKAMNFEHVSYKELLQFMSPLTAGYCAEHTAPISEEAKKELEPGRFGLGLDVDILSESIKTVAWPLRDLEQEQKQKVKEAFSEKIAQKFSYEIDPEIKNALKEFKDQPEKFLALATETAKASISMIIKTCELLNEVEWPSEELKNRHIEWIVHKTNATLAQNSVYRQLFNWHLSHPST